MICPYCRTEVAQGEGALFCNGCGTPHHTECYEENGGCTLFGCKYAPPDEPKVAVLSGELSGVASPWPTAPASTGFGDVSAGIALAPAAEVALPPPPPPPPPPVVAVAESPTGTEGSAGYVTPGGLFASLSEKPSAPKAKSRIAFIMLGIFFGSLGIHNFYAGFFGRGVAQLCITLFTIGYGSVVSWIWAVVEVCTVEHDKHNIAFT